jgi:YD repeat-containing protein
MTLRDDLDQGYDLAGNLTLAYSADGASTYQYHYDHLNRLTSVYDGTDTTRKAAFTWDALGRRVEFINDKLGTTRQYFYDGDNEVVEYDGSGNRSQYYVHGPASAERLAAPRSRLGRIVPTWTSG